VAAVAEAVEPGKTQSPALPIRPRKSALPEEEAAEAAQVLPPEVAAAPVPPLHRSGRERRT